MKAEIINDKFVIFLSEEDVRDVIADKFSGINKAVETYEIQCSSAKIIVPCDQNVKKEE